MPIWLVGPGQAIEAAVPQIGPSQVSGVVVTSVISNAGSCSRTTYYSNPGNGTAPKMVVKTSGDACDPSPPSGARRAPADLVPVPQVKPAPRRIIDAIERAEPALGYGPGPGPIWSRSRKSNPPRRA